MNPVRRIPLTVVLGVALGACLLGPASGEPPGGRPQVRSGTALRRFIGAKGLAIRLMYWPPDADHTYYPRIFLGVEPSDLNFGCWTFNWPSGTTVFVASKEVTALAEALVSLDLEWHESPRRTSFNAERAEPGSPVKYKVPVPRGKGMQVDLTCDEGSATAELPADRMCAGMPTLEKAFDSPRGVYSIQLIESEAGCKLPGFDPHRLPERR